MTTRLSVPDLLPATPYAVRVRARNAQGVSGWSRPLLFTTIADEVIPEMPLNATWVVNGDSFHGEWDAVTTNEEGDTVPITRYEIELVASAMTRVTSVVPATGSSKNTFNLSFLDNKALFGTAQPAIQFRVRAVDNKELKSAWTSPITATNAAPGAPTMKSGFPTVGLGTVSLAWDAPADTDIFEYRVKVGTSGAGPFTTVYQGASQAYTYTNIGGGTYYFQITTVDKFGQESSALTANGTPTSAPGADTTPPAVPSSFAGTITNNANGLGAMAALTWVNGAETDRQGIEVQWKRNADGSWFEGNRILGADATGVTVDLNNAFTAYDFRIRAFDHSGNFSAWSSTLAKSAVANTAPSNVAGLVSTPSRDSIIYSWTASTDADLKTYEVTVSTSNTFASGNLTYYTGTAAELTAAGLTPGTTYYARVRAVDQAGATSAAWSSTDTETTLTLGSTSDRISVSRLDTGVIGSSTGLIDIQAGAILRINGGYLKSNTYTGTSQASNPSGAGFYLGDDGLRIDTGNVKASTLTTGTISGTNTITLSGANARIESSGYTGTAGSGGFRLSGSGLDIPDGTFSAAKLAIQLGENLLPAAYSDFEFIADNGTTFTGNTDVGWATGTPGKFGQRALVMEWTKASGTAELSFTHDPAVYNVPVVAGTPYILSAYVWNPEATGSINCQFHVFYNNSTSASVVTQTVSQSTTAATAHRPTAVFTPPAGVTACYIKVISSTTGTSLQLNFDGVMIEEKTSSSTTPSSWSPGAGTFITGGQIQTGAIRSNNFSPDDPSEPMWSINLDGSAQFSNLSVIGNTVLGSIADTAEDTSTLQSANFVEGSAGWRISSTGLAEFRDIVTGSLSPTALAPGELHEDTTIVLQGAIEAYGPNGETVGFSAAGFYSRGLDDLGTITTFVEFPTDGARPNIISGVLDAVTLNINGDASGNSGSLSGAFIVNNAASVTLASVVTPPVNPPTVTVDWEHAQLTTTAGKTYNGFVQGHDSHFYTHGYNTSNVGGQTWGRHYIRKWDSTTNALISETLVSDDFLVGSSGTVTETINNLTRVNYGMAYIPGLIAGAGAYVIIYREYGTHKVLHHGAYITNENYDRIYVKVFNTSLVEQSENVIHSVRNSRDDYAVGQNYSDGSQLQVAWRTSSSDWTRNISTFTYSGGTFTQVGGTTTLGNTLQSGRFFGTGQFDLTGVTKHAFISNTSGNKNVYFYETNAPTTLHTASTFKLGEDQSHYGMTWNSTTTKFEGLGVNYKRYTYQGGSNKWDTGAAFNGWHFKYSWWDSTGTNYETARSGTTSVTMYKRARVTVTTDTIPYIAALSDTPNRARIYQSIDPTPTTFDYFAYIEQPGQSYLLAGQNISGNTGAEGSGGTTFPATSNPGKILGDGLSLAGDGKLTVKEIQETTLIGEVKMWAGGPTSPTYNTATLTTGPNANWLICNGAAFSSVTYPELAAVVGDQFGTHSGTTYYLPDLARRVPVGAGGGISVGRNDGIATTAANTRTFAHTHGNGTLGTSNVSHTGAANTATTAGGAQRVSTLDGTITGTHNHTVTGTSASSTFDDIPSLAINFIIRAK